MRIVQAVDAPEGSAFTLTAYDHALGKMWPLMAHGEQVGIGTLIGAIPNEGRRRIVLTWELDEFGKAFLDKGIDFVLDPFVPSEAFNPEAALNKLRRAGMVE